jgi:hypothetical protein
MTGGVFADDLVTVDADDGGLDDVRARCRLGLS